VIAALVVLSVLVVVAVAVSLFALAVAIQAARAAAMSRRPAPTPTPTPPTPADNIKTDTSFWSSQEALFRSFEELLKPTVLCAVCGQRNRLGLSRGGARCGRCKQMLMH
jgi:hypothetical protein